MQSNLSDAPRAAGAAAAGSTDAEAEITRQVRSINLRVLQALQRRCARTLELAQPTDHWPLAVAALREVWRTAPQRLLERAAQAPYLLIDAGFAQPERWHALAPAAAGVADTCIAPEQAPQQLVSGHAAPLFEPAFQHALARTVFVYAWHLARTSPMSATLAFGAASGTLELLRTLPLPTMQHLAERCASWIELRWADRPGLWAALLAAAGRGDDEALRIEQLKGLQRIAGACCAGQQGP